MMRQTFLIFWLILPVVVLVLHFGPGQYYLQSDRAGAHLRRATQATKTADWSVVESSYAQAREALPAESVGPRYELALAEAGAMIRAGQIVRGQQRLVQLLANLEAEPVQLVAIETRIRNELAATSYYAAWRMRLAGADRAEWWPQAERARLGYRYLAEDASRRAASDAEADPVRAHRASRLFARNLEATIKFERMDLEQLQKWHLPRAWQFDALENARQAPEPSP